MKPILIAFICAGLFLGGCAASKDYEYHDYQISRENAYATVKAVLTQKQYRIVEIKESNYKEPEIYFETDWNHRDDVYRGNRTRRKAYVRIITRFTDREKAEFQPLEKADKPMTAEEREKWEKENAAAKKKGELEITTVGIAIRRERLNDVKSPADILDGDWVYEGPDVLEGSEIFGKLELILSEKRGAGEPTDRSLKREKDRLSGGAGK